MSFLKVSAPLLVLVMSLVGECLAVPAYPHPMTVKNPDGSEVVVRKVGNEKLHYTVSEEGNLVVRDSLGFWNYADESGVSTGVRLHKRGDRSDVEKKFLEKRNPKDILRKFVKAKRDNLKKADSLSAVLPLRRSVRSFARTTTALDSVLSVATRPPFDSVVTMGEGNVLVVLVEFSDVKFASQNPQQVFQRFLNEEGYSENGMRWSVRDYFVENSMGKLKPTFDVAAPVTLSKSQSYYGLSEIPDEALKEAINAIKSRGDVTFSKYDRDGDRYVDYVYMIYAGVGEADSDIEEAIWPQAGYMWPINVGGGYYVEKFACSSELNGVLYVNNPRSTALAGMGVLVHEYSHVLGLPDFYDTRDTTGDNYSTPYIWSLMDMGEYNTYSDALELSGSAPPRLTGFERFSLGWLTPRILRKVNGEVTLRGIDMNDAIIIPSSRKNEYFVLDYRAKYDEIAPLPNSGLLVWRIAYDKNAWVNTNVVNTGDDHRMNFIRADKDSGLKLSWFSYSPFTDTNLMGDPFPGYKKVVEFDQFVTYSGENLGLRIYDIVETDSAVTFKVEWENPDPISSSSEEVSSSSALPPSSSSVLPPSSSSAVQSSSSTTALPEIASAAASLRVEAGVLYVDVGAPGQKTVRIFDMQGRMVQSSVFTGNATSIGLGGLPHGSFFVRVDAGARTLKKGVFEIK